MAVNGTNLRTFVRHSFSGSPATPIYRFHTKTLYRGMRYRVAIRLIEGSVPKNVPYAFIVEVLGMA